MFDGIKTTLREKAINFIFPQQEIKGIAATRDGDGNLRLDSYSTSLPPGDMFTHVLNEADQEDNNSRRIRITSPYLQNVWVMACINVGKINLAQVPFRLKLNDKDMDKRIYPARLFDWVSPNLNRFSLWEGTFTWRRIRGEAFWEKQRAIDGTITRLNILNPDQLEEQVDRTMDMIVSWKYTYGLGGEYRIILASDIVQFKNYNPYNKYRGLSDLTAGMLGLDTDYAAQLFNRDYFRNPAIKPKVIISSDQRMNENDANAKRDQFIQKHGGEKRDVMVMGQGAGAQLLGAVQKDISFVDLSKWERSKVYALLNTPAALVQDTEGSSQNKADITAQRVQLYDNNLIPEMHYYESVIDSEIIQAEKLTGVVGAFDLSVIEVLREGLSSKLDTAKKYWDMGVPYNNLDEKFDLGTGPIEGGDVGYIPSSVVPVGTEPQINNVTLAPDKNPISPPAPVIEPTSGKMMVYCDGKILPMDVKGLFDLSSRTRRKLKRQLDPIVSAFRKDLDEKYFYKMRTDILKKMADYSPGEKAEMPYSPTDIIVNIVPDMKPYNDKLEKISDPYYAAAYQVGAKDIAVNIGRAFVMNNPTMLATLAEKKIHIKEINNTIGRQLRKKIRKIVDDGLKNGDRNEVIKQSLIDGLKGTMKDAQVRAATIAQTEISGVVNNSRIDTMKELGVQKHAWSGSMGAKEPRIDHHGSVDGEVRMIGEKFSNGLRWPHDNAADAEDVINCECQTMPAA